MISALLQSLIESIVEEELVEADYRATLRGTKDFRKPVVGLDPAKLPLNPRSAGDYGNADFLTGKDKGRLGVSNPRLDPEKRDNLAAVKK